MNGGDASIFGGGADVVFFFGGGQDCLALNLLEPAAQVRRNQMQKRLSPVQTVLESCFFSLISQCRARPPRPHEGCTPALCEVRYCHTLHRHRYAAIVVLRTFGERY